MRVIVGVLLLACCTPAPAQVAVELLLEQKQFLRDESLPVKVRISNRSGQTLRLGQESDWLTFSVLSRDGHPVARQADVIVKEDFLLESASAATRRVDLMPGFALSQPGRYTVTTTLRIKDWGQEIVSKPQTFDIIPGFRVWEQEFGVPAKEGAPEVRKYTLQQANYLNRLLLYLRLTDEKDTRVFRVQPLGPLVSFSRPEAQVDRLSNLHVLFQMYARSFYYVVVSPHGEVLRRETHEYAGQSRPVLRADEHGSFSVSGGARRRAPDDLPLLSAESGKEPAPAGNPKLQVPDSRSGD